MELIRAYVTTEPANFFYGRRERLPGGNRKAGAGLQITGDRPLFDVALWSIRSNISPEAFIDIAVPPGQASSWRITYEFYQVPPAR